MMTPLTLFGLFAVTAMLVCYALEKRSPWFILAFALSCALGSVYHAELCDLCKRINPQQKKTGAQLKQWRCQWFQDCS